MATPLLWQYEQSSKAPQGVIREDLLGIIVNISPRDTPFLSGLDNVPCKGVYHEWPRKALAARAALGFQSGFPAFAPEGAAFLGKAMPTTTRNWNLCGILKEEYWVSGTQQAIDQVPSDRMALEIEDALAQLSNSIEVALFLSTVVAGDASTARSWSGVFEFCSTQIVALSTEFGTSTMTWNEETWNTMLRLSWQAGGQVDEAYMKPQWKTECTAWVPTGGRRNIPMADRRLVSPVDVLETEYGIVKLFKTRDLSGFVSTPVAGASAYAYGGYIACVDSKRFRWAVLRTLTERLPKDGDRDRGHALVEGTLEVLAEEASVTTKNACFDYY